MLTDNSHNPCSSNQKSYPQCLCINFSRFRSFLSFFRACFILLIRLFSLISKNIQSKKATGRRNTHTHHTLPFNIGLSCLRILAIAALHFCLSHVLSSTRDCFSPTRLYTKKAKHDIQKMVPTVPLGKYIRGFVPTRPPFCGEGFLLISILPVCSF